MTEAKIYLGNLSYDTRERWIDVDSHSVVVVVKRLKALYSVDLRRIREHLQTIL